MRDVLWEEQNRYERICLHIFQCMDAQNPVQLESIIGDCYIKGLNLLIHSVHIDIHPIILYVFDMFIISTIHQENSLKLKNG